MRKKQKKKKAEFFRCAINYEQLEFIRFLCLRTCEKCIPCYICDSQIQNVSPKKELLILDGRKENFSSNSSDLVSLGISKV